MTTRSPYYLAEVGLREVRFGNEDHCEARWVDHDEACYWRDRPNNFPPSVRLRLPSQLHAVGGARYEPANGRTKDQADYAGERIIPCLDVMNAE